MQNRDTRMIVGTSSLLSYIPDDCAISEVTVLPFSPDYKDFKLRKNSEEMLCLYMDGVAETEREIKRLVCEYVLFRRKVLGGSCPTLAPFGFVKTLFCELIDTPEKYVPHVAFSAMENMLSAYRGDDTCEYGEIMFEWMTDFALVNSLKLSSPPFLSGLCGCDFVRDRLLHRFFREYFSGHKENAAVLSSELAIAVGATDGDYYCASYTADSGLYDYSMKKCLIAAMDIMLSEKGHDFFSPVIKSVMRPAYSGLAVQSKNAKRLLVKYKSYSSNLEFCETVCELMKYVDNTLRRGLGIKSKIPGVRLDSHIRLAVQRIICDGNPMLFGTKKRGRRPKRPIFEDKTVQQINQVPRPVKIEVNLEKAKELEKSSWDIASRLGVEYSEGEYLTIGETEPPSETQEESPSVPVFADEWEELSSVLNGDLMSALRIIADGGNLRAFAVARGALPDAYVVGINEAAQSIIGDILIENTGALAVIADYRDDVRKMLEQQATEVM